MQNFTKVFYLFVGNRLLEKQMVGEFYDRGRDGLPRKWIKRALTSAATIPDFFSTNRMVSEYATRAYGA